MTKTLKELKEETGKEFENKMSKWKLYGGFVKASGDLENDRIKQFIQQAQQQAFNMALDMAVEALPEEFTEQDMKLKKVEEFYSNKGHNRCRNISIKNINQLKTK